MQKALWYLWIWRITWIQGEYVIFDLKETLYEGMILREKDFRQFLKDADWSTYQGKNVGLICTADAIVPTWAYMLLVTKMKDFANSVTFGDAGMPLKSH